MAKKSRKIKFILIILFIIGFFSVFFLKTGFTVNQITNWQNIGNALVPPEKLPELPKDDPNRLNILLLGIRGAEEEGEGKLLSDTIILASFEPDTGQTALISLPRDIYAIIYCTGEKQKINFAYAQGGIDCAKKTISYITGQYIDYAISVDFAALTEIVDTLGGIDISLDEPFEENFQWAREGTEQNEYWFIKEIDGEEKWVFYVPAGQNHLDGQIALYYARSRYSTNDFDRMRRQQQIIMAIKEKAFSLKILANPVKIFNLLDILGKNVRTDLKLADIKDLIDLSVKFDTDQVKKRIFDTSSEGLLYQTFINEEYVLLPNGDNFTQIQEACRNIFK
ncbi:LCP family protein [Patescibacteria group bacterium]|nr:LCP family protein [Patescibacteria group bacterium]